LFTSTASFANLSSTRLFVIQVIIAHDVDPIELVVWLPALCRK
jgi:hypothetical protein